MKTYIATVSYHPDRQGYGLFRITRTLNDLIGEIAVGNDLDILSINQDYQLGYSDSPGPTNFYMFTATVVFLCNSITIDEVVARLEKSINHSKGSDYTGYVGYDETCHHMVIIMDIMKIR